MFQKDNLFPWRTVYKNVVLGLEIKGKINAEDKKYVLSLLNKYGLKDFIDAYPSTLSGGMRQRVALIRTLALKPNLLLLDEPFSALDYITRLNLEDDVNNIIRKEQKSAIIVTHDISEAISLSDRVIVISKRPSKILGNYQIKLNFEGKEHTPTNARTTKEFQVFFDKIYKDLSHEE
jgi:NitT/TauT family transport system ATP-binding protein